MTGFHLIPLISYDNEHVSMSPKVYIFNQIVMFRQRSPVMLNKYLKNVPVPIGYGPDSDRLAGLMVNLIGKGNPPLLVNTDKTRWFTNYSL